MQNGIPQPDNVMLPISVPSASLQYFIIDIDINMYVLTTIFPVFFTNNLLHQRFFHYIIPFLSPQYTFWHP